MRLFQKPAPSPSTEPPEDDPSESLGNALFWGALFWIGVIAIPTWFLVDEEKRGAVRSVALTLVVLDLMCAWLVATMIKKWFKRKHLVAGISVCLIILAVVLYSKHFEVWAIALMFAVCAADFVFLLKMFVEGWLSHYDDDDRTERGP